MGDYLKRRRAILALALHANTSTLTAIGNDYGYDQVYSHQIEGLLREGDVAVGLSTSGNSENVLRGILSAKKMKVYTIGLLGKDGGKIAKEVDVRYYRSGGYHVGPYSGMPHADGAYFLRIDRIGLIPLKSNSLKETT